LDLVTLLISLNNSKLSEVRCQGQEITVN